ncbi:MAG: 4-hydroxythreonine-4-phosphate dehydrogenase PdxA, partial [Gemmatimonadetes bacterium]|nr:4-hydroxythreonine-4-phosphate dehydrogenase PdxA [Gemmatimonadota bacterium]
MPAGGGPAPVQTRSRKIDTHPNTVGGRDDQARARARIALTLGDVRGIGPEVARKALEQLSPPAESVTVVAPEGEDTFGFPAVRLPVDASEPGRAAGQAIEKAVQMALLGEVDAIVTGPIHKPSLTKAGFSFPGHTEMLQALTGAVDVGMLMCHEAGTAPGRTEGRSPLRILLATTHVALRDVPQLLTAETLVRQTRLLWNALRGDWGIETPRIALCAFNPHASDEGLFGDEESRIYEPALETLSAQYGMDVTGPVPADSVFRRALQGEFDAVVAPYHDVGMAAFKTVSFGSGVNVTLGLPFVRTSPDHGTAFGIAGKDAADPTSMG